MGTQVINKHMLKRKQVNVEMLKKEIKQGNRTGVHNRQGHQEGPARR